MNNIYEELKARGLIAQCTNEEKVKDLWNNEKISFYIRFYPTADSFHVGHFLQMVIMSHLQKVGHRPIVLFGGGTGLIGDPSGKTDMRKMLTNEQITHNILCFKRQMEKFIDFKDNKAIIVNNADWLKDLNYIEFLRNVGIYFSINRMLAAECYKARLEKGLTFFELNYMIMQSYDFYILNRDYDCVLQLGGDDQWSNIIGGVELIRKIGSEDSYGLTFKLLTTADGRKMGKTAKGALWLNPDRTSPYEFYQYWRNIGDTEVRKVLNLLTFLPDDEVDRLSSLKDEKINEAKKVAAFEITKLIHGEEEAIKAAEAAEALFGNGGDISNMPSTKIEEGNISILDVLIIKFKF